MMALLASDYIFMLTFVIVFVCVAEVSCAKVWVVDSACLFLGNTAKGRTGKVQLNSNTNSTAQNGSGRGRFDFIFTTYMRRNVMADMSQGRGR